MKRNYRKRKDSSSSEEDTRVLSSSKLKKREKVEWDVNFASSGTAQSLIDNNATRTLQVDADVEIVAGDEAEALDQNYQGLKKYKDYLNNTKMRAGPVRSTTYVRLSSRFDYAPDVCKDYKESGYCGFGDSCKFMHDRSDYKSGWELEKEWQQQQKRKEQNLDATFEQETIESEPEDSDDDLPFACLICRGDFKSPVVTQCKHYFCEACALKAYVKTPKCQCCGANTMGMFNIAKDLVARLNEKHERMKKREAEIREANKDMLDPFLDDPSNDISQDPSVGNTQNAINDGPADD